MAGWAFATFPLIEREEAAFLRQPTLTEPFSKQAANRLGSDAFPRNNESVIIAAYYLRAPWSDAELVEIVKTKMDRNHLPSSVRTIMERLGDASVDQRRQPDLRKRSGPKGVKSVR